MGNVEGLKTMEEENMKTTPEAYNKFKQTADYELFLKTKSSDSVQLYFYRFVQLRISMDTTRRLMDTTSRRSR